MEKRTSGLPLPGHTGNALPIHLQEMRVDTNRSVVRHGEEFLGTSLLLKTATCRV
jgi:hypothetical protein